ncbi:hypothetical protein Y032_0286g1411 [Ancylostoma ceylanicum]|uniref:Uncharacterized protein n=1 Tax=Ancylostoma ceylanicum TaxID=53326 RepID=A0A016S642_9BILA|nr:hypothetical protein Y032_0286g1411 [Ancylostoma ceylanicum]
MAIFFCKFSKNRAKSLQAIGGKFLNTQSLRRVSGVLAQLFEDVVRQDYAQVTVLMEFFFTSWVPSRLSSLLFRISCFVFSEIRLLLIAGPHVSALSTRLFKVLMKQK